ncbi:hypothetical protein [Promicromonospora soli]
MLVFIIIGLLGLVLAVASLVLGDFLELADGALSGTSLGAGGLLFGATGMVVLSSGLEPWVAYPAGLVVAALVIILVNVLLKRLKAGDDGAPVSLVGVQGAVTSDVDRGHGEVSLDAVTESRQGSPSPTSPSTRAPASSSSSSTARGSRSSRCADARPTSAVPISRITTSPARTDCRPGHRTQPQEPRWN